jgi:hypothetical protein
MDWISVIVGYYYYYWYKEILPEYNKLCSNPHAALIMHRCPNSNGNNCGDTTSLLPHPNLILLVNGSLTYWP